MLDFTPILALLCRFELGIEVIYEASFYYYCFIRLVSWLDKAQLDTRILRLDLNLFFFLFSSLLL